jgi:hypothetical protein
MSNEKMREDFEAEYLKEYDEETLYGNSVFDRRETYCGDEVVDSCEYENEEVQHAWEWFAKSRAALCVELPKIVNSEWACTSDECAAMRDAIRFCKRAIESTGVRTR